MVTIMRKPGIIIYAAGSSEWIGGIYYAKNILYQLSINKIINKNYSIYVFTNQICKDVFTNLKNVKVIVSKSGSKLDFMKAIFFYNIRYRYPGFKNIGLCKAISWIPDFQQECMSDMFPEKEIEEKRLERQQIVIHNYPLILSSNDSLNQFRKYYSIEKQNVYVMHFVSYIEPEIRKISSSYESEVLLGCKLKNKKYIYIANQFWKHKNHIVVLEAIRQIIDFTEFLFVFSGKMSDYRNPDYIKKIESLFDELGATGKVHNLGFLDRTKQLVIMKNCEFLIQPSLFEGWGTVVEDAKVLDKTVLLSDIPVHREQKNEKCILFDPFDALALAKLICEEEKKQHFSDIEKGIANMKKSALKYSEQFAKLLEEEQ